MNGGRVDGWTLRYYLLLGYTCCLLFAFLRLWLWWQVISCVCVCVTVCDKRVYRLESERINWPTTTNTRRRRRGGGGGGREREGKREVWCFSPSHTHRHTHCDTHTHTHKHRSVSSPGDGDPFNGLFRSVTFWSLTLTTNKRRNLTMNYLCPHRQFSVKRKRVSTNFEVVCATNHENDNPVEDMTSADAYAIRATVHGTTRYPPAQLVHQKDMILRTKVEAETDQLSHKGEKLQSWRITKEKTRGVWPTNTSLAGDRVLILSRHRDPKTQLHRGPYKVLAYDNTSGTLHIRRNKYM